MIRKMWRIGQKYFNNMREYSKTIDSIVLSEIKELINRANFPKDFFDIIEKGIYKSIGKPHLWPYFNKIVYEICGGRDSENFSYVAASNYLRVLSQYGSDDLFDSIKLSEEKRSEIEDLVVFGHVIENVARNLLIKGLENMDIKKETFIEVLKKWDFLNGIVYEIFFSENHKSFPISKEIPSEDEIFKRLIYFNPVMHTVAFMIILMIF